MKNAHNPHVSHGPNHKWLLLGLAGFAGGIATLWLFRSVSLASGSAAILVVGVIAAKHLALLVAAGSPFAALVQHLKPKVRAYCPFAPHDPD